jgi:hypothetical protein
MASELKVTDIKITEQGEFIWFRKGKEREN